MFDDPELEETLAKMARGTMTTPIIRQLEHSFRRNFTTQLRNSGGIGQPIESGISAGVPDAYCAMGGLSFWIEFKMIDSLLGSTKKLPFRVNQREWLLKNILAGGMSFVGAHFLDGYAFARADVVARTGGAIPFGDYNYKGYILTQKKLDVDAFMVWAKYAATLVPLVAKVSDMPARLQRPLMKGKYIRTNSL